MMEQINISKVHDAIIRDIVDAKKISIEDAEKFFSSIKEWCSYNVSNTKWSNKARHAKSLTSYGLKHVCERDLGKYVANNWVKAALYEEGFSVKVISNFSGRLLSATTADFFLNTTNFVFKV